MTEVGTQLSEEEEEEEEEEGVKWFLVEPLVMENTAQEMDRPEKLIWVEEIVMKKEPKGEAMVG
jgi:hypothetical protein